MKNLIFILSVIACVALIVFGVMLKNQKTAERQADIQQSSSPQATEQQSAPAAAPALSGPSDSAPIASSTAINPTAKRFRPDQQTTASTSISADPERTFILTPEIISKKYLVDKYKIGICFGGPVAIPGVAVKNLIAANPPFSEYLRKAYLIKTDQELYNKIKQFQTITLTETASSVYKYVFSDGQCQTVIYQEGVVRVVNNQASDQVTVRESHSY